MRGLASSLVNIADQFNLRPSSRVDNREGVLSAGQIRTWKEDGILCLPSFFSSYDTDKINQFVDDLWANRRRDENPFVIDVFVGRPDQKRMKFADAPDDAKNFTYKLNDLFLESDTIRAMALDERLCGVIKALLRGDAMVFNSLTLERGSQQEFHFDTFYMPPPVKNKMLAAWIALEDCHPDAGPLAYYPGSHKIPPYLFSNGKLNAIAEEMPKFREQIRTELQRRGMEPISFMPKRGDVLLWHAQMLHGGLPIKDPARTRKSLVCHYFRQGDFPPWCSREFAPGRFYFVRDHQKADD